MKKKNTKNTSTKKNNSNKITKSNNKSSVKKNLSSTKKNIVDNNTKKKNVNKYLIVLICFVLLMSLSLIFFMYRLNNIDLNNEANHLLKDLYNMDSGEYSLRNGIIYQNNYKIGSKAYFKASGDVRIDKYKNVRFNLVYEDKCISKTYMGNININKGECKPFKRIVVKVNRNNNKISFISNTKNLDYKISDQDDFLGEWNREEYKDNLVLKSYNEGTNYIWFKDSEGNLSGTISFKVDCLYTSKAKYDNKVFYCSGSTVNLDGMDFVVIKDDLMTIKLMKFLPIDEKLSHCKKDSEEYCNEKNIYNWDNSYVNYYLNNEFINKLSNKTKDALLDNEICTDLNSRCNDELCIGRSRDEINRKKYRCLKYSTSKIKLISYEEFNYVYNKSTNKNVLNGYYSSINSFYKNKASSVQYDRSIYVYEDLYKNMNIKPVILLFK